MKNIIVTGGAGFIGTHLVRYLLSTGQYHVTCVDNFEAFYNPAVKRLNIAPFLNHPHFTLVEEDILNSKGLREKIQKSEYEAIIHLAAKAGVRPSILNPDIYQEVNVTGTKNVLELAKEWGIKKFVFGSSSSVYGVNPKVPWHEDDFVLRPISPYAATKVEAELMGHVYSYLYGITFVGLRFFTVYGPGQRPDLAIHKFTKSILAGQPIPMYGDGSTSRDYTYVTDIVSGIIGALNYNQTTYEIINLGGNKPVTLTRLIEIVQEVAQREAIIEQLPDQPGDVPRTYADISKAQEMLGYQPQVDLKQGITNFYHWYIDMQQKLAPNPATVVK